MVGTLVTFITNASRVMCFSRINNIWRVCEKHVEFNQNFHLWSLRCMNCWCSELSDELSNSFYLLLDHEIYLFVYQDFTNSWWTSKPFFSKWQFWLNSKFPPHTHTRFIYNRGSMLQKRLLRKIFTDCPCRYIQILSSYSSVRRQEGSKTQKGSCTQM